MAMNDIIVFATSYRTGLLEKAFDIDLNVRNPIPEEIENKILKYIKKTHCESRLSETEVLSKARCLKELLEPYGGIDMKFCNMKAKYMPLKRAYPKLTWL